MCFKTIFYKKMKISKGQSEAFNQRTDNVMATEKRTKQRKTFTKHYTEN